MATPSAMAFHDESRKLFRDIAMNKVQYKKQRWYSNVIDRDFKGFPKTSTGSWNAPFGWTLNDNGKPFNPLPGASAQGARLRGGIRDNKNYPKVKQLLQQRARDMDFQDQPDIPQTMPLETLTEDDKLKLELNNILLRIDDLVETGEYNPLTEDLWRKVIVILATIAPKLDVNALNDQIDYWDNIIENMEGMVLEKGYAKAQMRKTAFSRLEYVRNIREYIVKMTGAVNRPEKERILLSRALLKEYGLTSANVSKILKEARDEANAYMEAYVDKEAEREMPEDEEEEDEEEEGTASSAMPTEEEEEEEDEEDVIDEKALALARFDELFKRSPSGPGQASPDLIKLFRIVSPGASKARSRTQIKNAVRYLLSLDLPKSNTLRNKLEEILPEV